MVLHCRCAGAVVLRCSRCGAVVLAWVVRGAAVVCCGPVLWACAVALVLCVVRRGAMALGSGVPWQADSARSLDGSEGGGGGGGGGGGVGGWGAIQWPGSGLL